MISVIVRKNQGIRHLIFPTGLVSNTFDTNTLKERKDIMQRYARIDPKSKAAGIRFRSNNVSEYHDPYLLTGEEAMLAVKYLYSQGELFYNDIPHERALLRNQEERRRNGLHDHILKSLRPTSPFWKDT